MDGGEGGRDGLAAQGCRVRQGLGKQVEGGKTESEKRVTEVGRNGCLFGQAVQNHNETGKLGAKSGAAPSKGGGWEGDSGHVG